MAKGKMMIFCLPSKVMIKLACNFKCLWIRKSKGNIGINWCYTQQGYFNDAFSLDCR